jgi:hypothetical protein
MSAITACFVSATSNMYQATGVLNVATDWGARIAAYKTDISQPTVTMTVGSAVYTANGVATSIVLGLTVADTDSPSLTGATVTLG